MIITGGAPVNPEIVAFFQGIGISTLNGYGITECAPLIAVNRSRHIVPGSVGSVLDMDEVRIDEPNEDGEGEILVKGPNVMLGYYKNPEATEETLRDGWYHTGDLGIIDRHGNIFIKGRIKNMLLGPSGQNIYPEEIEDKLNNLPYVQECVVVQREGKLYGLVYPDPDLIQKENISPTELVKKMEENRKVLNTQLPAYEQITEIIIRDEEFEKTPKRSIKRFLYS